MSRPRMTPGNHGTISVRLVDRKVPADVDLFRSVNAPDAVLDWARTNPGELMKLVDAVKRRNRKVEDIYQAETRYRPRNGTAPRKVRARGSSEKAAREALLLNLADLNEHEGSVGASGLTSRSTLNALLDHYQRVEFSAPRENLTQVTIDGKLTVIKRAIRPRIGQLTIAEFRGQQAADYAHAMLEDRKVHDYKEARIILKAALDLAVRYDLIRTNPMTSAPKAPRASKREIQEAVVVLTSDQVQAMRRSLLQWELERLGKPGPAPSPRDRYFFDVLASTGTRISEALALRVRDVYLDAEKPFVEISGTIVQHKGKGILRQPFPKGKMSSAKPLGRSAVHALARQLESLSDRSPDALVFPTRNQKPINPNNMRRSLRHGSDIIKSNDVDFVFYPHLTRKTAATAVHAEFGDERTAGFLSHADTNSLPHYVKRGTPEADFELVRVLDELLPILDEPAA